MFEWLTGSRKRIAGPSPTLEEERRLELGLWQASFLDRSLREKLVRWCRVFIREKNWEGCNGFRIDEQVKWTVAAGAGLLVLAYEDWYYDRTKTILVYPSPYLAQDNPRSSLLNTQQPDIMGIYPRAGQTIYRGPVIVNWQDVLEGAQDPNDGNHLVIHEFSHQLDLINDPFADGHPPLPSGVDEDRWRAGFKQAFDAARSMVEQGHRVLMEDYGLSKESEFFAVGSEYYFQQPSLLARYHPQLFQLLDDFYQVDLRRADGMPEG